MLTPPPDFPLPQNQLPGNPTLQNQIPGNQIPGNPTLQNQLPGNPILQNQLLGNSVPQHQLPGNPIPQNQLPGNPITQNQLPGNPILQNQAPGNSRPSQPLQSASRRPFGINFMVFLHPTSNSAPPSAIPVTPESRPVELSQTWMAWPRNPVRRSPRNAGRRPCYYNGSSSGERPLERRNEDPPDNRNRGLTHRHLFNLASQFPLPRAGPYANYVICASREQGRPVQSESSLTDVRGGILTRTRTGEVLFAGWSRDPEFHAALASAVAERASRILGGVQVGHPGSRTIARGTTHDVGTTRQGNVNQSTITQGNRQQQMQSQPGRRRREEFETQQAREVAVFMYRYYLSREMRRRRIRGREIDESNQC